MYGCLDNNIEHPAFARLGIHALIITPFDTEYDLERVTDTNIRSLMLVRELNLAAFCRELQFMSECPRTWPHER